MCVRVCVRVRVCVCVCLSEFHESGTVHGVLGPWEQFDQGPEGVLLVHVDQQQRRDLTHTLTVAHFLSAQEVRLAGREEGKGAREGRIKGKDEGEWGSRRRRWKRGEGGRGKEEGYMINISKTHTDKQRDIKVSWFVRRQDSSNMCSTQSPDKMTRITIRTY